ncbi:hypothetical protein [Singulisphaera sp. GP187]|uniref:hypothetical protein n=1 Tax=Singulisphaera sp. GP187 TaxID=1882752 RepID=UPI00116104CB|nr:hypothetical protein [Singulisphaera sp. GP187]
MSIPEGSELRAQLYLASKIANALATFPPRIPEAREQMKELASDLAGTTFGWGLAGAIIARAQDQLLRLFPRLSAKHLHVYMAKWFDHFLDDPHLLHTEEVCTSKGHYVEVVLANILVESLITAYRTAMAR